MKLETKDYIIGGIALGSLALALWAILKKPQGGWIKIAEQVTDGTTNTMEFSNLPSYKFFKVIIGGVSSPNLRFNDDIGENYVNNGIRGWRNSLDRIEGTTLNHIYIAPTDLGELLIDRTHNTILINTGNTSYDDTYVGYCQWNSIETINKITLYLGGNFPPGAIFSIYGIN